MSRFKVKLVMVDLDGTLAHTAPEIAAAANLMLADLSRPMLPVSQVESFIGEGVVVLIKRCLNGHLEISQLNAEPHAALMAQAEPLFFKHYANNATDSKPFDGVIEGLQALRSKGFKLACVTNKPEKFTLPLLQKSGLAEFFEIVVSGDSLPKKKPDPMQLQYICEKLDVHTFEAMLVGDSETDIAAAHAAGCFIVTVPYGYNQGRPIDESKVDETIADLTELVSRDLVALLA
ncbi:MAG: phosphoglycolate phosphatase [Methylotenera sp.]|nr:phosphoglycolate phosphatase [Methylotenera sp.]